MNHGGKVGKKIDCDKIRWWWFSTKIGDKPSESTIDFECE
jgi:hypothetical protein